MKPPFEAGQLRRRVELQHKVLEASPGDRGQPVYAWTTFATVWAAITGVSGFDRKLLIAQQLVGEVTHTIYLRYNADLDEKCRLKWGSRIFGINYIWNHEERNAYLTLITREQMTGQK